MNRLARAGIAALARRARLRREDAEAGDGDLVAALKAVDDRINDRLDGALGVGLRGAKNSVHLVYDVCFVHKYIIST